MAHSAEKHTKVESLIRLEHSILFKSIAFVVRPPFKNESCCFLQYAVMEAEAERHLVAFFALASFPGSCVGGEKRAWYTQFVHAQFFQDFWEFGKSHKICSITLTSAKHADFSRIKDPCL